VLPFDGFRYVRLAILFATLPLMAAAHTDHRPVRVEAPGADALRFATFNASLESSEAGGLLARLEGGDDAQARRIAAIIQAVRPHVLLVNEFDFDASGEAARLFVEAYLGHPQFGNQPIRYPHRFLAPVNTGVASGLDLSGDGRSDGPADAWGYGLHPGQYGMLVLSAFPMDAESVRTFQLFPWQHMPQAHRPVDPMSGEWFHPDATWSRLRLSSKSHWDIPLDTPLGRIHLLAAHPTPPVFDGPENRNGLRNFDEIRLWADYIDPARGAYLEDDQGRRGALLEGAAFVIAGDYNADPIDGDSVAGAIQQLLDHPRIDASLTPRSEGGIESSPREGGVNLEHRGDPAHDTSVFGGDAGNLRVDYVLPSTELKPVAAGIFWPREGEPGADWVTASDHRLVWVDVVRAGSEESGPGTRDPEPGIPP
jgi:hypothetical protein